MTRKHTVICTAKVRSYCHLPAVFRNFSSTYVRPITILCRHIAMLQKSANYGANVWVGKCGRNLIHFWTLFLYAFVYITVLHTISCLLWRCLRKMFRLIKDVRVQRISADVCNLKENRRNAGHSKWANIKHIKAAKDAQKSVTFQKMSRLIRLAIQGKYHCRKVQQSIY